MRVLYDGVLLGERRCPALRSGLLTPVRLAVSRAGLILFCANPNPSPDPDLNPNSNPNLNPNPNPNPNPKP